MKIVWNNNMPHVTLFKTLDFGDVFKLADDIDKRNQRVFMKICSKKNDNAVDLESGNSSEFSDDVRIVKVNASLNIDLH